MFCLQISELISGGESTGDFSCARVDEYYKFGERFFTNLVAAFSGDTNLLECVAGIEGLEETLNDLMGMRLLR